MPLPPGRCVSERGKGEMSGHGPQVTRSGAAATTTTATAASDVISRRISEQIQNDTHLIEIIAVEIARALNLEGNNRTLGRKFVRLALISESFDGFKERSIEYGQIPKEILVEIYHKVKQKYSNLLVQAREDPDHELNENSLFGFSGKTETLSGSTGNVVKGGLQNRETGSHRFQKPEGSSNNKSLLGLDKHEKSHTTQSKVSMSWGDDDEFEKVDSLQTNVPQKRMSREHNSTGNVLKKSRDEQKRVRQHPTRSGIGLDEDEWEEPEQLSSNRDKKVSEESASEVPVSTRTNPRSTNTRRYGSLYNEEEDERERKVKDTLSRENRLNVDADDDFERDFYLGEEGQTLDTDAGANDKFLGSNEKFLAREAQMAKSRARGDQKIAGMSARKSQLHADQEAWEDNRLLQSGVASEREVRFLIKFPPYGPRFKPILIMKRIVVLP